MMAIRFVSLLSLALLAGCGTSPASRFYVLQSTARPGDAGATAPLAVLVGPVAIPGSVDRPQLVVQLAPNRVEVDEFHRWAAPLDDAIARTVAGDLSALLGTPDVATAPMADFRPAYRVTIDVQRFESALGEGALLDAVWTVQAARGDANRSGRTLAREPVAGAGFEELAAAHSRALGRLSEDVAAAIRALR